ncbi:MAG: hypothetical protein JJE35_12605 [Thermoleophilia bacterium]|nr:hypothetical protein [Thermoleophilia bacterium]
MTRQLKRAGAYRGRPPRLRSALAVSLLFSALLLASAAPAGAAEAGWLRSALAQMADLATLRLRPPALSLARVLPDEAARLRKLREPASNVQAQVTVALGELRAMNALTPDPHYLPALFAVGRAFVAVSGQDPLTGTTIDPGYLGLDRELAGSATRLDRAAGEAGRLSLGVSRLIHQLSRSKKRARLLERQVQRLRAAGDARPRQGD